MVADKLEIKATLLEVAQQALENGPGYAQEGYVLRRTAERLKVGPVVDQQRLLTAWQELFSEGALAWGYDLNNPSSPFFHKPE